MHGISPLLVQILNKCDVQDIPDDPSVEWLPGKFVSLVAEHQQQVPKVYPENFHTLKCGNCGKSEAYDLGLIAFDPEKEGAGDISSDDFTKAISMTNYYRCRHCNAAGNWDIPESLKMEITKKHLKTGVMRTQDLRFHLGPMQMYNGMQVNFVTEAEELILQGFLEEGEDAFIWDRLGNIYSRGGRPDLATAAFERALQLDDRQMESHQTLGDILAHVGEGESAAVHSHKALLTAGSYDRIEPYKQREILASILRSLFTLSAESNGDIPFLPRKEDIERYGFPTEIGMGMPLKEIDLEINPEHIDSFLPVAEMYMQNRRKQIRAKDRTLDKFLKTVSKHKQLREKRKRRKKAKHNRKR